MKVVYNSFLTVLIIALLGFNTYSQNCTASFGFDDTEDLTIEFYDQSTSDPNDPIVSWFWDFDDNETSTEQNPVHTFSEIDKYDVELTITTQSGCTAVIEIRIEICGFNVNYDLGSCDSNNEIPIDITISDIHDNADEIDVILDGQNVPGSPFNIDAETPVEVSTFVPGDGLEHELSIQSLDIATCSKVIIFTVDDCSSDCFLSGLNLEYTPTGITHSIDVGDDFFEPQTVSLNLGDVVVFDWIGDGHSTTSDATSGDDSWNSGVKPAGTTYNVNIKNPGTHPYYCIPHGAPGGVGMSGELLSNCPGGNTLDIDITFNASQVHPDGFNIYLDGSLISGSPFDYDGTGPQLVSINIPGDNQLHNVEIEDVNDPTCIVTKEYQSPDCDQGGGEPECVISITEDNISACDQNDNVSVSFEITANNMSTEFEVYIDGTFEATYPYDGSTTTVTLDLPGDGQSHTIEVVDSEDVECTATATVTTPNCTASCDMSNLSLSPPTGNGTPSGVFHEVEVEDFEFLPADITISEGDQVRWIWTGAVDHTSTSDASGGPDSWDSGLLGQGAEYESPVLSQGTHGYYCIPHGAPGGVGMAGSITVNPPCNSEGEVSVTVSFDVVGAGVQGYEILVDGVSFATFDYVGGMTQTASVDVTGDGQSHEIEVRDVETQSCTITGNVTTPQCGSPPVCEIMLSAEVTGTCDGNDNVATELTVTQTNASAEFDVYIDGTFEATYPYDGSTTTVTLDLPGDGQSHTIEVVDSEDVECTATATVTTPNCTASCDMSNLSLSPPTGNGTPSGVFHEVEVEDFEFLPADITISEGDQVRWIWTGAVDHTSTSDASGGPDSWDSGLLGQGAEYESPVLSQGTHGYYCIPHGAPGGVGMAGSITVNPPCNPEGEVSVSVSFDVVGAGVQGYEILVDGVSFATFDYVGGMTQTASVDVTGDGQSHEIEVRDVETQSCAITGNVTTPQCGSPPVCEIMLSAEVTGTCDGNDNVATELTVTQTNASAEFDVYIDGTFEATYPYDGSTTTVTLDLPGDGQTHMIEVVDSEDVECTATATVTTPNCTASCDMSNLSLSPPTGNGTPSGVFHEVEVEDFEFLPADITISEGDQVRWIWTGAVDHTSTSDASGGPDSWDSGLLGQGAEYESPVLSQGTHGYYCIPHGAPGGVGMAGSITVNPPCNPEGEVSVSVSFDVVGAGVQGYEILVDGVSFATFDYVGGMTQTASVDVTGDGQSHEIEVRDVETQSCTITGNVTTPQCGSPPVCEIMLSAEVTGTCDGNDNVATELTVTQTNASAEFDVYIDGTFEATYPYDGSTTTLTLDLSGDGQSHTIEVVGSEDVECTTTATVTTPNCSLDCMIFNPSINFSQNSTHIVEVRDFDFFPSEIDISLGDTINFVWVGDVAHTATSDVTSGSDQFDSGLLNNGDEFQVVLNNSGEHRYYCIPHGARGGIGMAGIINVNPPCDGNNAIGTLEFEYEGSSGSGFNFYIDDELSDFSPLTYNSSGKTSQIITVPGDGSSHDYRLEDVNLPNCSQEFSELSPDCNQNTCVIESEVLNISPCNGSAVNLEIQINSNQASKDFTISTNSTVLLDSTTSSNGNILIDLLVAATGNEEIFIIEFKSDADCMNEIIVQLPDCAGPCIIEELSLNTGPKKHIVNVFDFSYSPNDIEILLGDTILFQWTGEIPHTVTSDALTGVDAFNSGLLGQGSTYELVLQNAGSHPYYCIPHGGPGGIGMSGNIEVLDTCDGDSWKTYIDFKITAGSPSGYNIFRDGEKINDQPVLYDDPLGWNDHIISLPADNELYNITIQDIETNFCAFTDTIRSPICDPTCRIFDMTVNTGSEIIQQINVEDYTYDPVHIETRVGHTLRFVWTGEIPHTVTSDALVGDDVFDSGLLEKGDTFDIRIQNAGLHPYYCIPHGGPGGIGMSGTIQAFPECDEGNEIVELQFNAFNGSNQGYRIFLDGIQLEDNVYDYDNRNGENKRLISIPADGNTHQISVQDAETSFCARTAVVNIGDCGSECTLSDLRYSLTSKEEDTVFVEDFEFIPRDIIVEEGQQVRFIWVGDVPHTVTSDATTGNYTFNSGLLEKGSEWTVVLDSLGDHPYYCVPHGSPGGVGMAGNIEVIDECEDGLVNMEFKFFSSGNSNSYQVALDGDVISEKVYNSSNPQTFNIEYPADMSTHVLEINDVDDIHCSLIDTIESIDCDDICFGLKAGFESEIDRNDLSVSFTDRSTGTDIVEWFWEFGDGTTSNEMNPDHIYSSTGTYSVCLTVINSEDCEDDYCEIINFQEQKCDIEFDYDIDKLDVTFYDQSDISDLNYELVWNFDDGTQVLNRDSVTHSFEPGVYDVCLSIVSDNCSGIYCDTIDLSSPCLLLESSFSYDNENVNPLEVNFIDNSSGNVDQWLWGFGDGNTSSEKNPTHIYEADGVYNVCLLLQDTVNNCSSSYCTKVNVGVVSSDELSPHDDISSLVIFPNPNSGRNGSLKVKGFAREDEFQNARIHVYEVSGKPIWREEMYLKDVVTINREFKTGTYFLKVITGDKVYLGMFIVQNTD